MDRRKNSPTTPDLTPAFGSENPKPLLLFTQQAPTAGRIYKVQKERVVIGSVISADIQIQGEGIAPIHAVIEVTTEKGAPKAQIFDLASETGVFINGHKHVTALLKTGDELTIGRFRMKIAVEDARSSEMHPNRIQTQAGDSLLMPDAKELRPFLMENERDVEEIFDYRPSQSKTALETVMSWHSSILDIQHFVGEGSVDIGSDRENDFAIPPLLSSPNFAIAVEAGDGYALNIDPKMSGVVQRQGQVMTLEQAKQQLAGAPFILARNDFAKITIGEIDFYFSYTAAPPKLKRGRLMERDPFFHKVVFTSIGLTAAAILTMMKIEVPNQIEVEQLPERLATILYTPPQLMPKVKVETSSTKPVEQPEPKKQETPKPQKTVKVDVTAADKTQIAKTINVAEANKGGAKQKKQDEAKEGPGAKAKGPEGQRGSKTAAPGKDHQQAAKRPSPQGGIGRGGGNSQVQDQGNVDILKGAASTITNILGNTAAKLGAGGSKLQGFGNFSTLGKGGQALSGDGSGGGGDAEGLGGLTDHGRGGGRAGTGLGAAGNGSGIIGGASRVTLRTGGEGDTVVVGSIDKGAIAAAIEAHRDEFRLCYEREINADRPNISGTVKTSFVIGSSGRVSQAGVESSSLGNSNVERCVVNVLKRIDFPMPVGGGVVQVTYPFKYASSGK